MCELCALYWWEDAVYYTEQYGVWGGPTRVEVPGNSRFVICYVFGHFCAY